MKESTIYQAIVAKGRREGRVEEARRLLLILGEERFGSPVDPGTRAVVEAVTQLQRLESLVLKTLRVGS